MNRVCEYDCDTVADRVQCKDCDYLGCLYCVKIWNIEVGKERLPPTLLCSYCAPDSPRTKERRKKKKRKRTKKPMVIVIVYSLFDLLSSTTTPPPLTLLINRK